MLISFAVNNTWLIYFACSNMCHSVKNILFLKTHKTGGSTVANILFRFARSRDLTVALPRNQIFSFYWPWSFQVNFVDNLPGEKPNVLCSHARQVKFFFFILCGKFSWRMLTVYLYLKGFLQNKRILLFLADIWFLKNQANFWDTGLFFTW